MKSKLTKSIDASNKTVSDELALKRALKQGITFTTKLGAAKGVPKSRIWIEGKRLVVAGFTVGTYFIKEISGPSAAPDTLHLTLCDDDSLYTSMPCKVSGKGDKPIIDITGEAVRSMFGEHDVVTVVFKAGKIVITGGAA